MADKKAGAGFRLPPRPSRILAGLVCTPRQWSWRSLRPERALADRFHTALIALANLLHSDGLLESFSCVPGSGAIDGAT